MPALSEVKLAEFTGKTRATIRRRLDGLPFEDGPHGARLYDSKAALERIYIGEQSRDGQPFVSTQEAQRQLTIAKRAEIDQDMEIKARKHSPNEWVQELFENAFTAAAEVGKLHLKDGKAYDQFCAELRTIPDKIDEWIKAAKATMPLMNSDSSSAEPLPEA